LRISVDAENRGGHAVGETASDTDDATALGQAIKSGLAAKQLQVESVLDNRELLKHITSNKKWSK
jgi:hypothetical protein